MSYMGKSDTLALRACGNSRGSYGGFGKMLELPLVSELIYRTQLKGAGAGSCGYTGSQRLPLLCFALMVCLALGQLSHLCFARGDADEPTWLWPYKVVSQRANQTLCDGYWVTLWQPVLLGDSGKVFSNLWSKWFFSWHNLAPISGESPLQGLRWELNPVWARAIRRDFFIIVY